MKLAAVSTLAAGLLGAGASAPGRDYTEIDRHRDRAVHLAQEAAVLAC